MNVIEMHCLNALCDGYENVASITPDVRRATHFNVSEDDIRDCVRRFMKEGLVTAYTFDADQLKYVPDASEGDLSQRWFSITQKGRTELDQHWVNDEPQES